MTIGWDTARIFHAQIRKIMGMYDLTEVATMALPRINALKDSLPLEGLYSPRVEAPSGIYLSPKNKEVLELYAQGANTTEIAQMLGLERGAVGARRHRIINILGVKTIYQAVQKARSMGIITTAPICWTQ